MSDLKQMIQAKMQQPTLSCLATLTTDGKPWTRYVMAWADKDLLISFATFAESRKVAQIEKNDEVHLTLGVTDAENAESYLQIQGRAAVSNDPALKKEKWYEQLGRIFSGPDDPNYRVCQVTPYRIEYSTTDPQALPQIWEAEK